MQQTSSTIAIRLLAWANIALGLTSIFVVAELAMVLLGRASYQGQPLLDTAAAVFGVASVVFGIRSVTRTQKKQETIVLGALLCTWLILMIVGAVR